MSLKHPSWVILSLGLMATLFGAMASGCVPNVTTFSYGQPGSRQCSDSAEPRLVENGDRLFVWSYHGRLYVFGSRESSQAFQKAPWTEGGVIDAGAGPAGEEVVFASDATGTGNPGSADVLRERFRHTPKLLRRVGREYSVWSHKDRLFVLGPNTTVEPDFLRTGELILTKTFFSAGPHGETVVVEAKKDKNQFADLLMEKFNAQPILIDHRCPDYFVWKESGRLIVLGSMESSLHFETDRLLPDTHAVIGVGPKGETVSFEADKRHPELFRRLTTAFFGDGKVPAGIPPE